MDFTLLALLSPFLPTLYLFTQTQDSEFTKSFSFATKNLVQRFVQGKCAGHETFSFVSPSLLNDNLPGYEQEGCSAFLFSHFESCTPHARFRTGCPLGLPFFFLA